MKRSRFLIIFSVFIFQLFISCSLMYNKNTYVCIYECEHGIIEVECISEDREETEFLLFAYPENGYHINREDILVFVNKDKDSEDYIEDFIFNDTQLELYPAGKENQYRFKAKKNTHITISAFFTKQ